MNTNEIVKVRVLEVENEENAVPFVLKYRSDLHPNDVVFEEQTEIEPLSALLSRGMAMSQTEKDTLKGLFKTQLGGIDVDAEQAKLDQLKKDLGLDRTK